MLLQYFMKLKTGEALRSYSTVYKLQLEIPVSTYYDVLTNPLFQKRYIEYDHTKDFCYQNQLAF